MHCFAQSDKGTVRKENQDRAACAHIRRKGCTIAVVCDGMGGAAGGKLASDLAASTFLTDFAAKCNRAARSSLPCVMPAMLLTAPFMSARAQSRICAVWARRSLPPVCGTAG